MHIKIDRRHNYNLFIGKICLNTWCKDIFISEWYWNNKSPKNLYAGLDDLNSLGLTVRAEQITVVIARLAKANAIVNVCNDLIIYMRGLPVTNPSNDSNFLTDKIAIANSFLSNVLSGKYCIAGNNSPFPNWIHSINKKQIQWSINSQSGQPVMSDCYGPISNAKVKQNISEYLDSISGGINVKKEKREFIIGTLKWILNREIDALKSSIQSFYNAFQALPELYETEVAEGVTPEFKVELNKEFLDVAEDLIEDQNSPPEDKESTLLPKIIAGLIGIGLGVLVERRFG